LLRHLDVRLGVTGIVSSNRRAGSRRDPNIRPGAGSITPE